MPSRLDSGIESPLDPMSVRPGASAMSQLPPEESVTGGGPLSWGRRRSALDRDLLEELGASLCGHDLLLCGDVRCGLDVEVVGGARADLGS